MQTNSTIPSNPPHGLPPPFLGFLVTPQAAGKEIRDAQVDETVFQLRPSPAPKSWPDETISIGWGGGRQNL